MYISFSMSLIHAYGYHLQLTPVGTTIYQANPREFGRTGYTYSIVVSLDAIRREQLQLFCLSSRHDDFMNVRFSEFLHDRVTFVLVRSKLVWCGHHNVASPEGCTTYRSAPLFFHVNCDRLFLGFERVLNRYRLVSGATCRTYFLWRFLGFPHLCRNACSSFEAHCGQLLRTISVLQTEIDIE